MGLLRKAGRAFKNMSPVMMREIIAITVILCIAVALSLPQYYRDAAAAKLQKEEQKAEKDMTAARPEEKGMDSVMLETAAEELESPLH
jgi:hypothetical protein